MLSSWEHVTRCRGRVPFLRLSGGAVSTEHRYIHSNPIPTRSPFLVPNHCSAKSGSIRSILMDNSSKSLPYVWLLVAISLTALFYSGHSIYRWFIPKNDLTVSLNISFPEGKAVITGSATRDGKAITSGRAKLRIEQVSPHFVMAYTYEFSDGKFTHEDNVGITPENRFRISATVEAAAPGLR